jgi:hypothetical protein
VPAAAVIPAPIAYIKIVAVKKLVVGFLLTALVYDSLSVASRLLAFFSRLSSVRGRVCLKLLL